MTTNRKILPSTADILAPALAEFTTRLPKSFEALNLGRGVWAAVFAGLQAQAALAIAHLADGVIGNTLSLAKADQLASFVASEFEIPNDLGPTTAVGSMTLDRTSSTTSKLAGLIQKGRKIRRDPDANGIVPLVSADYAVAADTQVAANQNTVVVPIEAVRSGASLNTPYVSGVTFAPLVISDALFDKNFAVTSYDVGGGSDGYTDKDTLRYALSYAISQFGPTSDALVLAALRASGARHIIVDGSTVYVADQSWGGSTRWTNVVKQQMQVDPAIGYANRFNVSVIPSTPVNVSLTVRLRNTSYLADTTAIDAAITDSVRSYLDDRDDYNVVGISPLRSVVSRADRKVLRCTSATITKLDGTPFQSQSVVHAYLAHNAVGITYLPPI